MWRTILSTALPRRICSGIAEGLPAPLGPTWSTSASDTAYLERLLGGLGREPSDDWSTTMEQYGVAGGYVGFGGSALHGIFFDPTAPPDGVSQSQLAAEADALYASQGLADPTNTQIVIATQDGTCPSGFYSATCDASGSYCAWHSYTSLQGVPFTNLPYLGAGADGCGEYYVNFIGPRPGSMASPSLRAMSTPRR